MALRRSVGGGFDHRLGAHRVLRLNFKTDCSKEFPLPGLSHADKGRTLSQIMFWCIRGPEFARQRDHKLWAPGDDELPDKAVLLAKKLEVADAPLHRDVKTDGQLDNMGVELALLPPASWARYDELAALAGTSMQPIFIWTTQ